jgi:hypothetical protein
MGTKYIEHYIGARDEHILSLHAQSYEICTDFYF